ncbi:MAG: LamB/YcsF family protein [Acidobacteria bacterium]|nr:LamB/YcsF family protein [Acidobacteriota bacterium]MCI0625916.1 LamB/YcsF family protein [Acidobacteriota bacterium]
MRSVDINCDLGEGFGVYQAAPDEKIFPLISSANIACGFHAGDPQTMRHCVELAIRHRVGIGAHPGTPDLAGFGRRALELSEAELENALIYQVGALEAFCRAAGTQIRHVKPHGWLYNAAARDKRLAAVIANTLKTLNSSWRLFGLAGSESISAAKALGMPYAAEAFIDRSYEADGSLSNRSVVGSVITNPEVAAQQCLDIVLKSSVRTVSGAKVRVSADTLCIHGDNPSVLQILASVRERLAASRVDVGPLDYS